jgi:hypothetical protein
MAKRKQRRAGASGRQTPAQGAERHGLFGAIQSGSDEQRRVEALVQQIKLEISGGDDVLPLLYDFAKTQILLDRLQAFRHQREDESAQGGALGPRSVSWLVEGLNHDAALADAMASLDDPEVSDPPFRAAMRFLMEADEPLARGIQGLIAEDGFLRQLARYEQRALGQRRKAIEQITGYEISRRFMRQTA